MARYRKRRYYKRKSGKWAANISKIESTQLTATPGNWSTFTTLTSNPVQLNTTVSQIFTIKNMELTFQMESNTTGGGNVEGITIYIMYVPQGMNVGNDYHLQHPEYIMAYRFIGSPEFEQPGSNIAYGVRNPLKVKTRLARKLQTGDSIIAYFEGNNEGTTNQDININGLVRWWTKAN